MRCDSLLVVLFSLLVSPVVCQKGGVTYESLDGEIESLNDGLVPAKEAVNQAKRQKKVVEGAIKGAEKNKVMGKIDHVLLGLRQVNIENNNALKSMNDLKSVEGHPAGKLNDNVRSSDSTGVLNKDKENLVGAVQGYDEVLTTNNDELESIMTTIDESRDVVTDGENRLDGVEVDMAAAKKEVSRG